MSPHRVCIPISNIYMLNRWGHPINAERLEYQIKHGHGGPPVKARLGTFHEVNEEKGDYVHSSNPQDEHDDSWDHTAVQLDPTHPKYFLGDGHHRVRAAQQRGETHIEAEVEVPEVPHYLRGERKVRYQDELAAEVAKLAPHLSQTQKLGKSQREKVVERVASVAPFRPDGKLLFGRRSDNGKWTTPGGHLEPGEDAAAGAGRELDEETGLKAKKLERIGSAKVKNGEIEVIAFRAEVEGEPDAGKDPDEEFVEFRWVDPEAIPEEILSNLHSPKNVTLQLLGLQEKSLELKKGMMAAAAFRHKATGKVTATGPFHDLEQVPDFSQHTYDEGFVDHGGNFYTREEARVALERKTPVLSEYLFEDNPHQRGMRARRPEEFEPGLKKMHPGFRFPKLGLPDDRRETPIVDDPRQLEIARRAHLNDAERKGYITADEREEHLKGDGLAGAASTLGGMHSYAKGHMLRMDDIARGGPLRTIHGHENAPIATQLHESLHLMFSRVQNRYGMHGRRNLAENLTAHLKLHDHDAFGKLRGFMARSRGYEPTDPYYHEEHLTALMNYLNNPGEREAYHKYMKHTPEQAREYDAAMKRAHKNLWRTTQNEVGPTWVLKPKDKSAVEWAELDRQGKAQGMWKSEGNLQAQDLESASEIAMNMIGFNPQVHPAFAAAQFMVNGHPLTLKEVRQALYDHDGDYVGAALQAYHIFDTSESRAAVKSVMGLSAMSKAEARAAMPSGQDIQAGSSDAEAASQGVRRAFQAAQVRPVHLDGKHSKGSLIARDPDGGIIYLLKPGSGGQSVAAGSAQEHASQSRREVAFWHVANAWGLQDAIPRADLVLIDGREYAAIEMLPFSYKNLERESEKDAPLARNALGPYRDRGELFKWAVLDYVLGNPDRHGENLMVRKENLSVYLIDHGSAFAGDAFDPAFDKNSFVPYYLRVWAPKRFNALPPKEKLGRMPTASEPVRAELLQWLGGVHADRLSGILTRFGIDARPSMNRLAKVKVAVGKQPVDLAINRLWITT